MKEFDWKRFKDKSNRIVVHCKTEEEAIDFCNRMDAHGMTWIDGASYKEMTRFDTANNLICYTNSGKWTTLSNFLKENYEVIEYSDYFKDYRKVTIGELLDKKNAIFVSLGGSESDCDLVDCPKCPLYINSNCFIDDEGVVESVKAVMDFEIEPNKED